jgi:hypothetical protein
LIRPAGSETSEHGTSVRLHPGLESSKGVRFNLG